LGIPVGLSDYHYQGANSNINQKRDPAVIII